MTINIQTKLDDTQVRKMFKALGAKPMNRVNVRAQNEVMTKARTKSIRAVSKSEKLPQKFIRYRFDGQGNKKADRAKLKKGNVRNLTSVLTVYMRGLPVGAVAGAQTKQGVKAKGGRLYKGAFKATTAAGQGVVLKRRSKKRTPTMMPKIGLRGQLQKQFERNILSRQAQREYQRIYSRLGQLELNRLMRRYS
jgi:hypothetical protein